MSGFVDGHVPSGFAGTAANGVSKDKETDHIAETKMRDPQVGRSAVAAGE